MHTVACNIIHFAAAESGTVCARESILQNDLSPVSASHCDEWFLDQRSGYWVAAVENSCVILNATSSCSGAQITENTTSHETRCNQ